MSTFDKFTNLYSLSKTLRFELKPLGKTLEHIQASGILSSDEHRAESSKKVKKIIDRYHKAFIESVLGGFALNVETEGKKDSLQEYYDLYMLRTKSEVQKKEFETVHDNLRKQIANALSKDKRFKTIDKKELIKQDLLEFVTTSDDKALVEEFKDFTTYFTGFHENRKNMYSTEAKSTAIAYRLIHENLPKFIDNINVFAKVAESPVAENIKTLYATFAEQGYMNVNSIDEMFALDYFNTVLTQTQIELYNAVIGGKTEEDGTKIQGINEYINLYNQQQTSKDARLPKLKPLFKQILSDREQISWLQEEFKDDNQVLSAINEFYCQLADDVLERTRTLLQSIADYDITKIYIRNDLQLTDISQKMFGDWGVIQKAIEKKYELDNPKGKTKEEVYEERKAKYVKSLSSVSIGFLNECLSLLGMTDNKNIEGYFANIGAVNMEEQQSVNIITRLTLSYQQVKDLLSSEYPTDRNLAQDKANVALIKNFLDTIKDLQRFIKPLLGKGDESDKDEKFYGELAYIWEMIDKATPLYNKVRNYVTRKPYSTEKVKINFENSQLLNGWDVNKETDNTSIILRKDGLYYLAIMDKKANKSFKNTFPCDGECYEKMDYKQIATPMGFGAFVRKCFGSAQQFGWTCPKSCLNSEGKIIIKDEEAESVRTELIDCYKDFLEKYEKDGFKYSSFGFKFKDSSEYEKLSGFFAEIPQQGYKLSFRNVSVSYIDSLVNEGKLYLFQIYNKDFSPYSKGTPNMHTLYWKMLFDERNLADVVYKLNGQAEVFFRKSSIKAERPTHPANQPINNKNTENPKKQSIFEYDLIKDKRYTVDKFQFHVPITLNFKGTTSGSINHIVNDYARTADNIYFIGIDRGERHLLYITVIDSKGNIKEQYSLNEIVNEYNGNTYRTNYHDLLDKRDAERLKERQSWQTIENIKELKEGYLSQVIHKITQLMVKYHAFVVLEDLNMGFKRGRQKVESSVYQQFEKSLIDKLNYLVDKKQEPQSEGGLLKAYQLTNQFESFQKMGKQNGFLLYIPAWNTSKMDPQTGFVNLFDTRYESISKAQQFFCKFDVIRYNAEKDWFEFRFDYNNFTKKADGSRTKWTLCTWGSRIKTFRNAQKNSSWDNQEIDLTSEFKSHFSKHNIDIYSNLKEEIANKGSKEFFEGLLYLLKLTLQMRNSITGTETDYLISPVADENGNFYDSRTCAANLPKNADANGAYNIARKGLWVVRQIKECADDSKLKLAISNKEWLKFAQDKTYLLD